MQDSNDLGVEFLDLGALEHGLDHGLLAGMELGGAEGGEYWDRTAGRRRGAGGERHDKQDRENHGRGIYQG